MSSYLPHKGKFYSNISDGLDTSRIDFCHIIPDGSKYGIIVLKRYLEVLIYDFNDLLNNKENAKILNYKKCLDSDQAYLKMMKWIGKMVKKSVYLSDYHISRYYNNKADKEYQTPSFIYDKCMSPIYEYMESFVN